ncbi:PIN-like domain-containing protein [Aeromonas veronii]
MKSIFNSFYSQSREELKSTWESEKTIFVFDANVLLNLYGYAKQTREDFFKILEKLDSKVWIPYQVGLEYQRRRLDVIRNEKTIFNDIEVSLQKIQNTFKSDFEKLALKRRFPELFESTNELEDEINKLISKYKDKVLGFNNQQPCVRSHDEIRELIDKHFDKKVGERPKSQTWLDDLYKEGGERYKNRIPPGFKDSGKGKNNDESHFIFDGLIYERQFGDFILWKQLLVKAQEENIENVVFITDDSKEDWWNHINSNGKKITGPIPELKAEIHRTSNIKQFHMYNTSSFMEDGTTYLSVVVNESSIEETGIQHMPSSDSDRYVDDLNDTDILHLTPNDFECSNDLNIINQELIRRYENLYSKNESLQKINDVIERTKNPYIDDDKLNIINEIIQRAQSQHVDVNRMNKINEIIKRAQLQYTDDDRLRAANEIIERARTTASTYESVQPYIDSREKIKDSWSKRSLRLNRYNKLKKDDE